MELYFKGCDIIQEVLEFGRDGLATEKKWQWAPGARRVGSTEMDGVLVDLDCAGGGVEEVCVDL